MSQSISSHTPSAPKLGPRLAALALAALAAGCGKTVSGLDVLPQKVVGHCVYTNRFSQKEECRAYHGEWTEEQATDDCAGQGSTIVLGKDCGIETRLGDCILTSGERFTRVIFPGDDAAQCGTMKRGCELFGGGAFVPAAACGGTPTESEGTGLPVFQQPVRTCVDPKPGEAPGKSEGGKVCTWEAISGATEEGRNFEDYASCDRVRTQRPYYPVGPDKGAAQEDARMNDPAYVAEVNWVKSQIRSAACVCCHSTNAPRGASNWFLESGPNFVNSFFPRGLAMGAGWIDTVGFGAYPPEQNNGFIRPTPASPHGSIVPTTDPARMARFFEGELAHRGLTRESFAGQTYGAGPLDAQRFFNPELCENGEGVAADGSVKWVGGKARYLYVMEAGSANPTVPPNLDLPVGTLWRVDVPTDGSPIASGEVKYGELPSGTTQRFPAAGAPKALETGKFYYLYALADIGVPLSRCLFAAY